MNIKRINEACILFWIIMLYGCTQNIAVEDFSSIPGNEVLVFGKINILSEKEIPAFSVHVESASEENDMISRVENDKYFFWHLKPGKYKITYFQFYGFVRIWVDFEVENESPVMYIGNLEATPEVLSKVVIKNEFLNAKKELDKKYNKSIENISISIMTRKKI
ncbi:hypothetical protein MNBD_GAMMA11-2177 [hydrothermal vent metagenome]|uniref:Uncharacterized protein n=1 Tax=hydrothermal vent metagenome TaxID=652676 RepID=A0A3B0X518_9ZZZZ